MAKSFVGGILKAKHRNGVTKVVEVVVVEGVWLVLLHRWVSSRTVQHKNHSSPEHMEWVLIY